MGLLIDMVLERDTIAAAGVGEVGFSVRGGSMMVGVWVSLLSAAAATMLELCAEWPEFTRWGSFSREEPLPNSLLDLRVAERFACDDELGVESSDSALEE